MELSELSRVISPTLSRQLYMKAKQYDNVIDFTLGDPDFATNRAISKAAYKAALDGKTRYVPNVGLLELREEIAKLYRGKTFDNVAITIGATEAFYLLFLSILNKGDEVIILAPYWVQYENIVKLCGVRAVVVDDFSNEFEPQIESIQKSITSKTKAIIVNSPNNPSGAVYSRDCLKKIAAIAKDNDLYVISDEVYKSIIYCEYYPDIADYYDNEKLIIINSFSKQFAMTGWRVGYILANEILIQTITKFQQNIAVCASSISQYAALEAIKHTEEYSKEVRCIFEQRKTCVINGLSKCKDISYVDPKGTFYVFIDIAKTQLDSMSFALRLLEEEQVAVIPGIAFGNAFDNYVRLAFTLEPKLLEEGILRIINFITNS